MPRPSHPSFYTRDDREAPLLSSAGRGELVEMICPTGIAEYFCEKDWTTQISLNPQTKFDFTRTRFFHRLRLGCECIRDARKVFGEKGQLPLIECLFDGLIDATKRRFNPLQRRPALKG